MKVEQAVREFKFNGMALADPGATMSAEEVKTFYANIYPELNNAEIEGPEHKGAKAIYEFRRAVGTKGAKKSQETDRILRPAEIRQKLGGISNTAFYAWIKQGKIPKPKPIVPGGRATGVRESIIDAFIRQSQK